MVGTSFFRTESGKCPQCGTFGEEAGEAAMQDSLVCPVCDTVFNEYVILDEGDKTQFRNN